MKFLLIFWLVFIIFFSSSWEQMDAVETKTINYTNHLRNEKSPYLLQHANNPVDWYPWGEEAFKKAKKEGKPIFLSIGYATCHWCHVMAHESFEDEDVARLLNRYYVAIKVDREERPDVDKIYMAVCQVLTGRGGWPLSIFMTPDGKPFYAGTYFPKFARVGMPGFMDLLQQIATTWRNDRARILNTGEKITDAIQPAGTGADKSVNAADVETLRKGYAQLARSYDPRWGGFGNAPKFPTPHQLTFLLRWHKRNIDFDALEMVVKTLEAMRRGGIFDQIGFGFHRYSVDERWLVPHFEKMLYDQALLAMAYIEAYQVTGDIRFSRVAKEIFTYVLRDMTAPEGGFYSAEDADSEGKEGLFYVWTPDKVKKYLDKDVADLFCRFYDIREGGNFEEGQSIPNMPLSLETFSKKEGISLHELETTLGTAREKLFNIRKKRVPPLKDDKILTAWNGLMIAAFARGYQVFGTQAYAGAARRSADFILRNLRSTDGRLLRRYRQGEAAYSGYLDDYAFLVWGLIELYEATFEVSYLQRALTLNKEMIDIFWDKQGGGLYFTGKGNEPLITRSKEIYDGALPSGNGVAALNFLRLGRMTGNVDLEHMADELVRSFSKEVMDHPVGFTHLLGALDFMVGVSREIVIAGDPAQATTLEMINALSRKFLPNKVLLLRPTGPEGEKLISLAPFMKYMIPINNQTTMYICEQYACKQPITDLSLLDKVLN